MLGGALGNLADRLFRGHHGEVVDFLTFTHWPTFNVADAAITVGVVLLLAVLLWRRRPRRGRRDPGPVTEPLVVDRAPPCSTGSGWTGRWPW